MYKVAPKARHTESCAVFPVANVNGSTANIRSMNNTFYITDNIVV